MKILKIINKIFLVLLAMIVIFPIVWMLLSSFKIDADISQYPPKLFKADAGYNLEAYKRALTQIPFLRYYFNTVVFAGVVTMISLVFDTMAGYAFARFNFKGKNVLFVLILATLMVPFQVTMVPLYLQEQSLGILNTFPGLILPRATNAFGIFMMRQFFISLPMSLEEAARIDGATEFAIFKKIMVPLARPAIISLAIFHFMFNWNDLLYPLILTTSDSMKTLPAGLALFTGQHVSDYGIIMASAVMSVALILIIYIFCQKYFIEGMAGTGNK